MNHELFRDVIVAFKVATEVHKTNHWLSCGSSFYGDHEMYDRLHQQVQSNYDEVVEKFVLIGGPSVIDLCLVNEGVVRSLHFLQPLPTTKSVPSSSVKSELALCKAVQRLHDHLQDSDKLSLGLSELLTRVVSVSEQSQYLLFRRTQLTQ